MTEENTEVEVTPVIKKKAPRTETWLQKETRLKKAKKQKRMVKRYVRELAKNKRNAAEVLGGDDSGNS